MESFGGRILMDLAFLSMYFRQQKLKWKLSSRMGSMDGFRYRQGLMHSHCLEEETLKNSSAVTLTRHLYASESAEGVVS